MHQVQSLDRGRSVIEGAHIHIFGFFTVCEPEYMNMGPLNYRSSAVPGRMKEIENVKHQGHCLFLNQYKSVVFCGILRNPDRTRTWTRTRRKSGLGKNPDSCSDSRLRNPDSTIENPDSKSKILDSMKLDSDNIRNKFSSLICFWVFFSDMSKCLVMN